MQSRYRVVGYVVVFLAILILPFNSFSKRKPKIFNPDMEPVKGEWGKPHIDIGNFPPEIWSGETIDAAVKKKPLEGKRVTRVGEVIDVSCYLQIGKHGKKHAGCAKACIMNGQPIGLLDAKGNVYLLLPEEHHSRRDAKTRLRNALVHHVAEIVKVTGTLTNVKGTKAIYVQGFVKK